jgi:protein-tyrosine phosphatase
LQVNGIISLLFKHFGSAGIGRTGTLAAALICAQMGNIQALPEIVVELRKRRHHRLVIENIVRFAVASTLSLNP